MVQAWKSLLHVKEPFHLKRVTNAKNTENTDIVNTCMLDYFGLK